MTECPFTDPFKEKRQQSPVMATEFDGDPVAMILRYRDVKSAARDFGTFSSDAPFRVPIPREEDVRTVRQYPLEVDPPVHAEYRKITEPFYRRPLKPDYIARMDRLLEELVTDACDRESIEIVREFSIPLQSRALTFLLNMPECEAKVWIKWGTHVFRDESGVSKGHEMEAYCNQLFDQAEADPGEDYFSALTQATFQGRPLTREELLGYAGIAFAGGRDTIINTVATTFAHFARHPEDLDRLRDDPKLILTASEELIRFASPLTHIGRVCPIATDVHGVQVESGNLISLNWASANFDETVFKNPEALDIGRKPNPHIAFGSGIHNCLGAPHARLLLRTLIKKLAEMVSSISLIEEHPKIEREADYERHNSYHLLQVSMKRRKGS